MTYETILPLMMFALVSSITPGPNNLMLLASGANFGLRRSLPHMLGISLGFAFMALLVGIGLAQVFELYPVLKLILKVLAVVYMLYLAWKIANAAAPEATDGAGNPFTFLQAAAFQWVNPKAWAMALTAVTVYAPNQDFAVIVVVAVVFSAVNLPSVTFWALLGQQAQRILTNQRRLQMFNITMAILLLGSLYSVLFI